MPKVTVIIPLYNSEKLILDALESVFNQTLKDYEVIVVDDGSTDNSFGVVKSHAENDSRIKVFALGKNSGRPAVPKNYGLKLAAGQYIAFLDQDDIWLPNKLQEQVNFMDANKEIYLLYTKCYVQESGKIIRILPKKIGIRTGHIFDHLFVSVNFIFGLTVMLRNEKKNYEYFFDEDPRLKAIEDFDLWLRVAKNERVGFLDKPLAIYRMRKGSTSEGAVPYLKRNLALINKWKNKVNRSLLLKKYCILFIYMPYLVLSKIYFSYLKRPLRVNSEIKKRDAKLTPLGL